MSDDRDLRTYSRRSALGLMGIGGGLAATETLGFTNLTAGRGIGLSVANDGNAAVQLLGNNSGSDQPLSDFSSESVSDSFTVTLSNTVDAAITADSSVKVEVTDETISDDDSVDINVEVSNDFDGSASSASDKTYSETFSLSSDLNGDATITLSDDTPDVGNSLTFKFRFDLKFDGTELTTERTGITFETL